MANRLRLDIVHPALYPEVAEILRRLPPTVLFHTRYPYRHPAAIYQLSIRQLACDFRRLLADHSLARSRAVTIPAIDEQMAQSQRILIYSLREHLDDCLMILKCFVNPACVSDKHVYTDEILEAAGLVELKLFRDAMHNYQNSYLLPLVNSLKHSQGRIRTYGFEINGTEIRSGFYLEEVDSQGVMQPSNKLHGRNSAFSYARDIRANIGIVFKAGEALKAAIIAYLARRREALLDKPEGADIGPSPWTEVCKQVSCLDNGVFPQEVKQRFIRFSLSSTGILKIRELDPDGSLSFPSANVRCLALRVPDGMTNAIRVPYHPGNMPKIK